MPSDYADNIYTEPEIIDETEEAISGHEGNRKDRFSIDFNTLSRVLVHEDEDGEAQDRAEGEIRRQDTYRFSPSSAKNTKTQRIILYSPFFGSTYRASCFHELAIKSEHLPEIFSEDSEHLWWMHVQNPKEKELRRLCSAFRVHPLTIEDILNREIQEKLFDYTHYYFACLRSYRVDDAIPDKPYKPYTIYLVVFPTGTLSFCFSDSEHADNVLKRVELLKDYLTINSDWMLYAFVDDIVDSFNPSINQVEKKVNKIEDQVYTTRDEDKQAFIREIEDVRKSSSSLLRLLAGKNNVLLAFEKHHCGEEHEDEQSDEEINPGHNLRLYIHDVKDHVSTMLGNLHQFESLLARSQNNYLAGLSIDNMRGRQKATSFLNIMAVISMILTLMNIICALFSTNVNANVTLYANNNLEAWGIIIGAEAALALSLFLLARRLKWC